jgi:hypothetical protein
MYIDTELDLKKISVYEGLDEDIKVLQKYMEAGKGDMCE